MTTLLPLFLQSPPPSDHRRQIGRHYVYTHLRRFRIPPPDFFMRFALVISELTAVSCAQCAPANIRDGGATSSWQFAHCLLFLSPPSPTTNDLPFLFFSSFEAHSQKKEMRKSLFFSKVRQRVHPRLGASRNVCAARPLFFIWRTAEDLSESPSFLPTLS